MHHSVANTVTRAKISVWAERGSLPCNEVEDSVLSHAVLPHHTHDCCFVHLPCGFSITWGEDTQPSFLVRATKEILLLLVVISQIYRLALLMLSECLCLAVPHHCSDSSLLLHGALIYSGTEATREQEHVRLHATGHLFALACQITFCSRQLWLPPRQIELQQVPGKPRNFWGIEVYVIVKHLLCLEPAYTWKDW